MVDICLRSRPKPTDDFEGEVFVTSPGVTVQAHDGGMVFLHRKKGLVFTANHVGARVWEAVSRQEVLDGVADQLSQKYGVSSRQILEDSYRFLADLRKSGLIAARGAA